MPTTMPFPVLDPRNEDLVAAQAIGSLPVELSDRGPSSPAVVVIEAAAWILGKLLFQMNSWPTAVIQKVLALIGVTMNPAAAGRVVQTFTLSEPQSQDTIIEAGTQV